MSQDTAAISDEELAHYRTWTGRVTETVDHVPEEIVRRFAAAVDRDMPADGLVPPMWHYGLFLAAVPTAQLGPDGHPPRGGALPPVRLPRRMFAGSEMRFLSPLRIGMPARCVSKVLSVDRRKGTSGDLVLVRVEDRIDQGGAPCIEEVRTIIYLGAGARVAPVAADPELRPGPDDESWTPDSVALFRFSAVTFNTHRIHYDRPYAQEAELYPGLVVHGPFTALRLCDLAARHRNARPSHFSFRGEAPLFCGQTAILSPQADADGDGLAVLARRCDGKVAMRAAVRF